MFISLYMYFKKSSARELLYPAVFVYKTRSPNNPNPANPEYTFFNNFWTQNSFTQCSCTCIKVHVSKYMHIQRDRSGYIRIPSGYILWYVSGWYPDVSGCIPRYPDTRGYIRIHTDTIRIHTIKCIRMVSGCIRIYPAGGRPPQRNTCREIHHSML